MKFVELHSCSAFSFLQGGSFPEQLAEVAAELEMPAIALCDRNGVYGAQRFSVAAREHDVRPIIGAELSMEGGGILPVLVESRTGYKNLCELLTQAHLRSEKGKCEIKWDELPQFTDGLVAFLNASLIAGETPATTSKSPSSSSSPQNGESPSRTGIIAADTAATRAKRAIGVNRPYLIDIFGRENVFVEIQRHFIRGEESVNRQLVDLARAQQLSIIATNGVQ